MDRSYAIALVAAAALAVSARGAPPKSATAAADAPGRQDAETATPTSKSADTRTAAAVAYRATANLSRLAIIRAAVESCDGLPKEDRERALKLADESRAELLALLKREAENPTEDANERADKMRAATDPFAVKIREVLGDGGARVAAERMTRIIAEMRVLGEDGAFDQMADLSLKDKQSDKIRKRLDALHAKLKKVDARDGIPTEEKRADLLLATRKAVRDTFTDDQRTAWDAHVDNEMRKASAKPGGINGVGVTKSGTNRNVRPLPPPPPPTQSPGE